MSDIESEYTNRTSGYPHVDPLFMPKRWLSVCRRKVHITMSLARDTVTHMEYNSVSYSLILGTCTYLCKAGHISVL